MGASGKKAKGSRLMFCLSKGQNNPTCLPPTEDVENQLPA